MSTLLVFGASRGVGFEVARLARQSDHHVIAVSRSPFEELAKLGAHQFQSDACHRASLLETVRLFPPMDAVICSIGGGSLGASADGLGTANVIDVTKDKGIRRFILVSSLGAGNSRPYASPELLSAIGPILDEKTQAEDHLQASGLDYTIIRSGGLQNGYATGCAKLYEDPGVHGRINRTDLAALIVDCLAQPHSIHRIFSAIDPTLSSTNAADATCHPAAQLADH